YTHGANTYTPIKTTCTVGEAWADLAWQMGLNYIPADSPFDLLRLLNGTADLPQNATCAQAAAALAGAMGGNCLITRAGKLTVKRYSVVDHDVYLLSDEDALLADGGALLSVRSGYRLIPYAGGATGDTAPLTITGLAMQKTVENGAEQQTLTYSAGDGSLTFTNQLATQEITDAAFSALSGLTFHGGSYRLPGGLQLEPGDLLTVQSAEGDFVAACMALNMTLDGGCQTNITSGTGPSAGGQVGQVGRAINQITADIGRFRQVFADYVQADTIRGKTIYAGGLDNVNGQFIVQDADGNEIGRWDNDGVTLDDGRFAVDGSYTWNITDGGYPNTTHDLKNVVRNGAFYAYEDGGTALPRVSVWPCGMMLYRNNGSAWTTYAGLLVGRHGDGTMYNYFVMRNNSSSPNIAMWGETGNVSITGTLTQGSDRRLKADIRDVPEELIDAFLALTPRLYTLLASGKECAGFVAQEVQGTPLEDILVVRREEDDLLMLDYNSLHALELAAIQRQEDRIARLEELYGRL
ncbi:MAG: tail fiber domain-containing protein, partial [Oscillospiraceae bacterium]|nr:tail fiber domain-containing protein [Oscillospiraceae bacterium]